MLANVSSNTSAGRTSRDKPWTSTRSYHHETVLAGRNGVPFVFLCDRAGNGSVAILAGECVRGNATRVVGVRETQTVDTHLERLGHQRHGAAGWATDRGGRTVAKCTRGIRRLRRTK